MIDAVFQAAKNRYRKLKVHLLEAIRSNELLKEELKRYQRLLLRLNQDKFFLFERLLSYEKPPPKTTRKASDPGNSVPASESGQPGPEGEAKVRKKRGPKPKKKLPEELASTEAEDPAVAAASLPAPAALPAGQSLLKMKLPSATGSDHPEASEARRGQKRKADFLTESLTSEADQLFRQAASKMTEQVPDQLFE